MIARTVLCSLFSVLLAACLALLPLPYAALAVGLGAVGVLSLADPVWALYAAVLWVPLQEIVHLPGGLSFTQAALVLAAGSLALRTLAYPERSLIPGRLAPGLMALIWALALSATLSPYSRTEGLKETLRWTTVALIYVLAVNSLAPVRRGDVASAPDDRRWTKDDTGFHHPSSIMYGSDWAGVAGWRVAGLVVCLLVAPAANAVYGLWQFATASGPESFQIAGGRFVRAYGTIGQPNSFAGSLNMAWPLAVALLAGAAMRWREQRAQAGGLPRVTSRPTVLWALFAAPVAALLLAALVASLSRGGWVGAAGGALTMAAAATMFLSRARRWRIWRLAGPAAGLLALLFVLMGGDLLPAALAQRLASIIRNLRLFDVRTVMTTPENFAVVERMAHLQAGWAMFAAHPLSGVGPGSYTLAYEQSAAGNMRPFAVHPWYTSQGHAHNYYLHIAAEAGIPGAAAYLVLLALSAGQAWRALRRAQGWFLRSIAVGCCGIISAVGVHNLFENLHVLNLGIQLASVWGLLGVVERGSSA